MRAADCDKLELEIIRGQGAGEGVTNETEFLLSSEAEKVFLCYCADKTQEVRWSFNNGSKIPRVGPNNNKGHPHSGIYTRLLRKRKQGDRLHITKQATPLEFVGIYLCESVKSKTSISISIKGAVIVCV